MPKDSRRPYEAYVKEEITNHNALRIPKNTKIQGQFLLLKNGLIDN